MTRRNMHRELEHTESPGCSGHAGPRGGENGDQNRVHSICILQVNRSVHFFDDCFECFNIGHFLV